jgi:hypothetical protein
MAFLASAITERISKSERQKKETAKFCRLKGSAVGERPRELWPPRFGVARLARTLAPTFVPNPKESQPVRLDSCLAHVLAGTSLPESFRPL